MTTDVISDHRHFYDQEIEKHYPSVERFFGKHLQDEDDIAEASQQTILQFLNWLKKTKWEVKVDNVAAFLIEIAKNIRNDKFTQLKKERKITQSSNEGEEWHQDFVDAHSARDLQIYLEEKEELEIIRKCMLSLSPRGRMLIEMYCFQEISFDEISKTLGEPLDDIRYDFYLAKANLKYRVQAYIRHS